jgi:hypothetical protein
MWIIDDEVVTRWRILVFITFLSSIWHPWLITKWSGCLIVITMTKKWLYKSFDMNIDNLAPAPHLPMYLPIFLPTHPSTFPCTHPPIYLLPTYLPTNPPIHPPTYLLPTFPSTHPLTYLPTHRPTYFVNLPFTYLPIISYFFNLSTSHLPSNHLLPTS